MGDAMIKEALLEAGWKSSFAFPTASEENRGLLELVCLNLIMNLTYYYIRKRIS